MNEGLFLSLILGIFLGQALSRAALISLYRLSRLFSNRVSVKFLGILMCFSARSVFGIGQLAVYHWRIGVLSFISTNTSNDI